MAAFLAFFARPRGAAFFLALLTTLVLAITPAGPSSDLVAVWLAGEFLGSGAVYPPDTGVFTMTPPPEWSAVEFDRLFPYLYPPLWAVLAHQIVDVVDFATFATWARLVNAALLVCTVALAWRATGSRLPFVVFTFMGVMALAATFPGSLALMENQPQIIVSFLIILALERARSGAPVVAGISLAVAAALKVYPVLFALLWLATGQRRALAAFTIAGASLGGASVALAGWPLHAEFLAQLSTISNTLLLTPVSYALPPALAQFFAADTFIWQQGPSGGGWHYQLLSPAVALALKAAMLVALALIARAMVRADSDTRDAALWPLALVTLSLLGPLSWAYSYIPAIACMPALVDRIGPRRAGVLTLAILLPMAPAVVAVYMKMSVGSLQSSAQLGGTAAMVLLAGAFAWAAMARRPAPRTELRRGATPSA